MTRVLRRGWISVGLAIWGLAGCGGPGLEPPAADFARDSAAARPAKPSAGPMQAVDAGGSNRPAPVPVGSAANGADCNPTCTMRSCGDDGCGGSCGVCASGLACNPDGKCVCVSEADAGACEDAGCGNDCEATR